MNVSVLCADIRRCRITGGGVFRGAEVQPSAGVFFSGGAVCGYDFPFDLSHQHLDGEHNGPDSGIVVAHLTIDLDGLGTFQGWKKLFLNMSAGIL